MSIPQEKADSSECVVEYERHLLAARAAIQHYPETAARLLAEAWRHSKRWLGSLDESIPPDSSSKGAPD